MTQQALRMDVELLTYANAARARTGHHRGMLVIATVFIGCAIIEVLTLLQGS